MRDQLLNLTEQQDVMRWAQWALNVMINRPKDTILLKIVADAAPGSVKQARQKAKDDFAKYLATLPKASESCNPAQK